MAAEMTLEDEVRQASGQFYAALGQMLKGDASAMDGIWSQSEAIEMSPAPPLARDLGWEQVIRGFEFFAHLVQDGHVSARDERIVATGGMAYSTQIEDALVRIGGEEVSFSARSTNIYRRENDKWKVVLHHIDFAPKLADAVGRAMLQAHA